MFPYIPKTIDKKEERVNPTLDDFVKSRESLENVIPAKAGIQ